MKWIKFFVVNSYTSYIVALLELTWLIILEFSIQNIFFLSVSIVFTYLVLTKPFWSISKFRFAQTVCYKGLRRKTINLKTTWNTIVCGVPKQFECFSCLKQFARKHCVGVHEKISNEQTNLIIFLKSFYIFFFQAFFRFLNLL